LSFESSSVGSRPVFYRGLRSHRVRLMRSDVVHHRGHRDHRGGKPAAQRPSSSTSSPLPPLPYVEFHIRQQRCPIPLWVPLCPSVSSVVKKKNDRRQATRRGVAAVGRYTPRTFTRPLLAPPVCATPPTPRRTLRTESGNGTRFWGPDSRHPGGTTARSVRASIDCGTRA
jgi:hypothetical protein